MQLPDQRQIRVRQERGELTISRAVLTLIVTREAEETPGVAFLGSPSRRSLLGQLVELSLGWLGIESPFAGVRVDLGEGEVAVALTLVARYGVDLTELATTLRDRIGRAVRGMSRLDVRCVDVHVAAIHVDRALERRARLDAASRARAHFSFPSQQVPSA